MRGLKFNLMALLLALLAAGLGRDGAAQTPEATVQEPAAGGSAGASDKLLSALRRMIEARNPAPGPESSARSDEAPMPPDSDEPAPPPGSPPRGSVAVGPDLRVEMHVTDVPLGDVLRMLSVQSRRNIVASPNVAGTVTADLFDVSFEEALAAVLMPNGCTYVEEGRFIYVQTLAEQAAARTSARRETQETRVFHLNYVSTRDLEPVIKSALSEEGRIVSVPLSTGGTSSSSSGTDTARTMNLTGPDVIVVSDTPSRLREVERLIRELDTRPRQVLVEATILRAQLNEANSLGIDFNMLSGVNFQTLNSVSPGITELNTGLLPRPEMVNTNMTWRTDFNNLVPNGGFTFGVIKDKVAVFIRALEQITDTTVVANPKVLALNRQQGEVIVGRRDGYLTTTVTETVATQTVEFLETGTQLRFTPFIGNDGHIRMEIHPEDSSGGLNESNLPFKRTTEVTTSIVIRDGHTILIGGLFRDATQTNRSQVPYLGSLPGAGTLFGTTTDQTGREEVIILLTVHIVKDDETYAQLGAEQAAEIEAVRAGLRRGLMPQGRERLAVAHYEWALEHRRAGRLDKALWDARMALHLKPGYLPALQLKEELTAESLSEDEGGIVRDFIVRRLQGAGPGRPPATAPEEEMP